MKSCSAYLISIEYLDSSVEKTLRDVIDAEAEFDELLPHSDLQEKIRERIAERRLERMSEEIAREAEAAEVTGTDKEDEK